MKATELATGLTLIGFAVLAVGWLGRTVVYVHGMRVLKLVDEPGHRAVAPRATLEKERAAGGADREQPPAVPATEHGSK